MKTIMIAAPSSGSGKTTITMGIIRAILNRGYRVSCFKTGPDYIDTAFLSSASKSRAGNLDMHLQGYDGMRQSFSMAEGDLCIIEGAMGYFDGIYNTFENSSYDIARSLGVNTILVYTPQKEMFSCIPKIKGMAEFKDSTIKGVILNKISKSTYDLLKKQIESYTDVKVLGFVPSMEEIEIGSRHLGLLQSVEIKNLNEKIETAAKAVEENIDIDSLISMMSGVNQENRIDCSERNLRVGIARDSAFSFYYKENLELFEKCCEVKYFSPIKDKEIPECDLLYLGGGYPEIFKEELEANASMKKSIREYGEKGGCIIAECGGFMYLTEEIEGSKMVGLLKGKSQMTGKLQRFGYIDIKLKRDSIFGGMGESLTAHEFHKSATDAQGDTLYQIKKTMGEKKWECGYSYKNVFAGYPHINFLGNLKSFEYILDYVENNKIKNSEG